MLLYYITDRMQFSANEAERRAALLRRIADAACAGVDYIQLREKDLAAREMALLACQALTAIRENSSAAKLLINGRTDIALACGADGVHLPGDEVAASEVRTLWMTSCNQRPIVAVSAHSVADVHYAEAHGADFAVLAPVFEKPGTSLAGLGLAALREACATIAAPRQVEAPYSGRFGVLALGGVTLDNARECLSAGAAGVAGIRLFQSGNVAETVKRLRGLSSR